MTKFIRQQLCWVLAFALTLAAVGQQLPKDRLAQYNVGDRIRVHMADGSDYKGTIAAKTDSDFSLEVKSKGSMRLPYAGLRSVKADKGGGKTKWIVIGALAGAAVVIGLIFAARLHNEGAI